MMTSIVLGQATEEEALAKAHNDLQKLIDKSRR
jgi:hypothetical protein